jgi:hypothetical protein
MWSYPEIPHQTVTNPTVYKGIPPTDRIMQTQRLVSRPPIITDLDILLDHQVGHTQRVQTRRDIQSTLSPANDENRRILPFETHLFLSRSFPFSVVRLVVAQRPDLFWMAFQIVQICKQGMRLPLKLLPRDGDGDKSDYARAKTDGSFEREEKHDPSNIRERRLEFRMDILVKFEIRHLR